MSIIIFSLRKSTKFRRNLRRSVPNVNKPFSSSKDLAGYLPVVFQGQVLCLELLEEEVVQ